jgi:prepilin-type N-terminal cleavage/methylation domain-containing protein
MYPLKKSHLSARRHRLSQSGFTLIELLMVMAVIMILASITFGISRGVQNAQARAKAKAELAVITQGLEQFKSTYGDYPWIAETTDTANANILLKCLTGWMKLERDASDNVVLIDRTTVGESFVDPTKMSLSEGFPATGAPNGNIHMLDPWGNSYVYIYDKNGGSWDNFGYVLFSSGSDSAETISGLKNDGLLEATDRADSKNIDNIYAGE